ncbi:MAG: nucleoside kinase [Bacilli bacterium]|nr:nucleoside kinase [Bacilli bacterium]
MNDKIKLVFEDSRIIESYRGVSVREIIKQIGDDKVVALRVNGNAVNPDYEIIEDSYVNYITVLDRVGQKIYMNGLKYVYIKAVDELYGSKAVVNIKHSLDKSIYTEIEMRRQVDKSVVNEVKKKMKEIIKQDLMFTHVRVNRDNALEYVQSLGEPEKVLNYTYMTNDQVTMYEFDGDYNYFYYKLPPSTGMLTRFDLTYVSPYGVVLSYPINNEIPKYTPSPLVLKAFKTHEEKLEKLGVSYAGDINQIVIDGKISDFIKTIEILYDQNLNDVARQVVDSGTIKAVFISGPSSSGKTTTSKKLAMYLKALGKDCLVVSTDDYFVNRVDSPRKPDGSYEFEIVDALDIKLFNSHMKKLLAGEEVVIPTYNFIMGEKEYKRKPVALKENQILVVEGLHAINEILSTSIPKKNKLKLYISPFTPIGLDRHNHISTTDLRLLRRMVRDYQHRGYSADATLQSWAGMRSSEESYVYPYQREADVIINTSLAYEIGVLRTYAEPLLYSVSKDSENYEEAIRIINFLEAFINIPSDDVPEVSVLREFIGHSYFEQ